MEDDAYEPLNPNEFRLVSLPFETNRDAELCVGMERADVYKNKEHYDVLSYRWGGPDSRLPIRCNNKITKIPQNAADALRAIRVRGPKMLWVDSICVNQSNYQEKSEQIRLLPTIMQKSYRVILWMGKETENTGAVFELITQLIRARRVAFRDDGSTRTSLLTSIRQWPIFSTHTLPSISESAIRDYRKLLPSSRSGAWKDLDELFDRPSNPFTSAWVLEDVALSTNPYLLCGGFHVSWRDVCYGLEAYAGFSCPNMLRNTVMHTMIELRSLQRESLAGQAPPLSRVLQLVRRLESFDPRDKVFVAYMFKASPGFPQTSSMTGLPQIDYSLDLRHVYIEAAQSINADKDNGPYQTLSLIEDLDTPGSRNKDLPSWVPDWAASLRIDPLNGLEKGFCASGTEARIPPITTESLYLKGVVVDRVTHVGTMLPVRRPYDKLNISGTNNIIFSEWYELAEAKADKRYLLDKQRYLLLLHWAETIMAQGREVYQGPPRNATLYKENLVETSRKWLNYLETEDHEETEDLRQFYSECLPSHGRRFGLSKRGHFCLLPKETKPLDVIFIPNGSNVPFVFRQFSQDGNRKPGSDTIVGECYVHGAMFGDALTWDGVEEADFILE